MRIMHSDDNTAQSAQEAREGFIVPPDSAKPQALWYWRGGYISEEGIDAELQAFSEAEIGGVFIVNVDRLVKPQGPVRLYTPEWFRLMKHAIKSANAKGMEVNLYNGPGWSSSGGPWITPELSMKKLTWSELQVEGGGRIEVQMPRPPVIKDVISVPGEPPLDCNWYRDCAVVAFPTPASEQVQPSAAITSDDPGFDASQLNTTEDPLAGSMFTFTANHNMHGSGPAPFAKLVFSADRQPAVHFDYEEPFAPATVSVRLRPPRAAIKGFKLYSSDDGATWTPVVAYERKLASDTTLTVPVSAGPARKWKVKFEPNAPNQEIWISDLRLMPGRRIRDWTAKAGFDHVGTKALDLVIDKEEPGSSYVIGKEQVIDLTGRMEADGSLAWDAPSGNWTIIRFGFCPTGGITIPTPAGGQGLDVDKFSRTAVEFQWQNAVMPFLSDPVLAGSIQGVWIDSWEVGTQNWTDGFEILFRNRNNYEILEYLPVLTGRVVGSLDESERFLADFRSTRSDLFVSEYFGHTRTLANQHGLVFYNEPYHQDHFNSMDAGMQSDVPVCEIWQGTGEPAAPHWFKVAVSPARMAGRRLVGCEALTSNTRPHEGGDYSKAFWDFKVKVDSILAGGVNRFMFHVTPHNPWPDLEPGMTIGSCGQHFKRSNTWWPMMHGFSRYISRAQYLLQQGEPVSDILFSSGETAPERGSRHPDLSAQGDPDLKPPIGYDYDTCPPEVIYNRLRVENGRLVLPHGLSYALLVLPKGEPMSVRMAGRVLELVEAGATVLGDRPVNSYGLPEADGELAAVADQLWGAGSQPGQVIDRTVGSGRILGGVSVSAAMSMIGVPPDVDLPAAQRTTIRYIHRELDDGTQMYWLANSSDSAQSFEAAFRTTGLVPELWDPMTGAIHSTGVLADDGTHTRISMNLPSRGAMFVVFVKESSATPLPSGFDAVQELSGAWQVQFQPERGGPADPVVFNSLSDWKGHSDLGIRYFSGVASYRKTFDLSSTHSGLWLELGTVHDVAEVFVNGQSAGVVWAAPWRADLTGLVHAGTNELEIRVANTWVNRLIGDEQLPLDYKRDVRGSAETEIPPAWYGSGQPRASGRITYTTFTPWKADSPLRPSGLLGPVRLLREKE